jgi:hypothetical protein
VRLPLLKTLIGTALLPWHFGRDFFKPLALPALLLVVMTIGVNMAFLGASRPAGWVLFAGFGLVFTLFAVTCHRIVLLGPESTSVVTAARWSMRETRFALWLVALYAVYFVVMMVSLTIFANLIFLVFDDVPLSRFSYVISPGAPTQRVDSASFPWLNYLGASPAMYCFARLSLLLPATAIDRKIGFRSAWQLSRHNGWRLVLIVGVLPQALSFVLDLLLREEATVYEIAALVTLLVLTYAIGIVALSLSYRELTASLRDDPEPQ